MISLKIKALKTAICRIVSGLNQKKLLPFQGRSKNLKAKYQMADLGKVNDWAQTLELAIDEEHKMKVAIIKLREREDELKNRGVSTALLQKQIKKAQYALVGTEAIIEILLESKDDF